MASPARLGGPPLRRQMGRAGSSGWGGSLSVLRDAWRRLRAEGEWSTPAGGSDATDIDHGCRRRGRGRATQWCTMLQWSPGIDIATCIILIGTGILFRYMYNRGHVVMVDHFQIR